MLSYTTTAAGGSTPTAGAPVTTPIVVNDRSGTPWSIATVTDETETAFTGQPSPPEQFNQLGLHNTSAPALPTATTSAIASGPNTGFEFATSVTAGDFRSSPHIHPDLTKAGSRFRRFHTDPSRLYFTPNTGARILIPLSEYSALSVAGGTVTFTVPNFEAFFKRHGVFTITATGGGNTVTLQDAWWGLDANAIDANIVLTNEPAVRAALGIGSTDALSTSPSSNGSWEGFRLMPSAAILSGTQSHEYRHAVHSHRANFHAMMRALDPRRLTENTVSTPSSPVVFATRISDLWAQIILPNHELVDEAASLAAGSFVPVTGATMAGVNTDPASGATLGSVWDITHDTEMT